MRRVRVGIRPSPLAYRQAHEALPYLEPFFPGSVFDIVRIQTPGDLDKETPLDRLEGTDFFTRSLDEALLRGEIDSAVHSSKDLPDAMPAGLKMLLETPSLSPWDALVSREGLKLSELSMGSRVGTSSRRRKAEVSRLRPDLRIVDTRGTIEERLEQIQQGRFDALIVAYAALLRLGMADCVSEVFSDGLFVPHSKQGRLSVLVRI
ncbi:MAG: hydroxymethylbilane synthase [Candidatus Omnitrophota bacterium]